jgi:hypothetical protein
MPRAAKSQEALEPTATTQPEQPSQATTRHFNPERDSYNVFHSNKLGCKVLVPDYLLAEYKAGKFKGYRENLFVRGLAGYKNMPATNSQASHDTEPEQPTEPTITATTQSSKPATTQASQIKKGVSNVPNITIAAKPAKPANSLVNVANSLIKQAAKSSTQPAKPAPTKQPAKSQPLPFTEQQVEPANRANKRASITVTCTATKKPHTYTYSGKQPKACPVCQANKERMAAIRAKRGATQEAVKAVEPAKQIKPAKSQSSQAKQPASIAGSGSVTQEQINIARKKHWNARNNAKNRVAKLEQQGLAVDKATLDLANSANPTSQELEALILAGWLDKSNKSQPAYKPATTQNSKPAKQPATSNGVEHTEQPAKQSRTRAASQPTSQPEPSHDTASTDQAYSLDDIALAKQLIEAGYTATDVARIAALVAALAS